MTWKFWNKPRFWAGFFFFWAVVGTAAFIINPQPYGLFGFLNYMWAYMLWQE